VHGGVAGMVKKSTVVAFFLGGPFAKRSALQSRVVTIASTKLEARKVLRVLM
jgi:hypothetical protein